MEHDSNWLNENPLGDQPAVHDRAPPAPADEFYLVEHATTHNGKQAAIMLDYAIDQLLESGALSKREQDALEHLGSYLGSLAPGNVGAVLEQLAGSQHANLGTATQDSLTAERQPAVGDPRTERPDTRRRSGVAQRPGQQRQARRPPRQRRFATAHTRPDGRRRLVGEPRLALWRNGGQVRQQPERQTVQGRTGKLAPGRLCLAPGRPAGTAPGGDLQPPRWAK